MVLFIAVILLVLLIPAYHGPTTGGPKAIARNELNQIITAITAYHTDYGAYPISPSISHKTDVVYGNPGSLHYNSEIINVLRADGTDPGPNFQNALNTQKQIYLDVPTVKDPTNPKNGLGTGKEPNGITTPGEWYDPWGTPYMIFIDANDDGICDLGLVYSDFTSTAPHPANPHTSVAAASLGPDKQLAQKVTESTQTPTT